MPKLVGRQRWGRSSAPARSLLQAPAPCPEGATRIAGRASAMFGRLDKSARATLLAFAGHPQLDEVQIACNHMWTTLQPYVDHPATLCGPPCNSTRCR